MNGKVKIRRQNIPTMKDEMRSLAISAMKVAAGLEGYNPNHDPAVNDAILNVTERYLGDFEEGMNILLQHSNVTLPRNVEVYKDAILRSIEEGDYDVARHRLKQVSDSVEDDSHIYAALAALEHDEPDVREPARAKGRVRELVPQVAP